MVRGPVTTGKMQQRSEPRQSANGKVERLKSGRVEKWKNEVANTVRNPRLQMLVGMTNSVRPKLSPPSEIPRNVVNRRAANAGRKRGGLLRGRGDSRGIAVCGIGLGRIGLRRIGLVGISRLVLFLLLIGVFPERELLPVCGEAHCSERHFGIVREEFLHAGRPLRLRSHTLQQPCAERERGKDRCVPARLARTDTRPKVGQRGVVGEIVFQARVDLPVPDAPLMCTDVPETANHLKPVDKSAWPSREHIADLLLKCDIQPLVVGRDIAEPMLFLS